MIPRVINQSIHLPYRQDTKSRTAQRHHTLIHTPTSIPSLWKQGRADPHRPYIASGSWIGYPIISDSLIICYSPAPCPDTILNTVYLPATRVNEMISGQLDKRAWCNTMYLHGFFHLRLGYLMMNFDGFTKFQRTRDRLFIIHVVRIAV